MTKTLEEADELIDLAKKNNLIIQVGHIERFNSAVRAIEPLLEKPKFIECQRLGSIRFQFGQGTAVLYCGTACQAWYILGLDGTGG